MPPNSTSTIASAEKVLDTKIYNNPASDDILKDKSYRTLWGRFKTPLIWGNIIGLFILHAVFPYAFATYPYLKHPQMFFLLFSYNLLLGWFSGFCITAGVHRLWTHRSYKAILPVRIILMIGYAMAGHSRLSHWVRNHRVHHKCSETDGDPHNSNRGFFFAHVGWLMMKKHPEVIRKGKLIDNSDLLEDPCVRFFERYFESMRILWSLVIPTFIPYYFWNVPFYWAFLSNLVKIVGVLNCTFTVNSAAHFWGYHPYAKNIAPAENLVVSLLSMGEGWHNYHHTFPWDYRASELGPYSTNITTFILDILSKFGWVYDLKLPSPELIQKCAEKNGDGTWNLNQKKNKKLCNK